MKVTVNKKTCIGCGACVTTCEDVFEIKDGKANVKESKTNKECAKKAVDICPVQAIKVE